MTLFKSSINLSHEDISALFTAAGWDVALGRSLHLLQRNPTLPLTAANAAVVNVPSSRYLTTIWRSSKDAAAYGKGVAMLAKNACI